MNVSTHKKVVVRQRQGGLAAGFLEPAQLGTVDGLDLLSPQGQALRIPADQVQAVFFVTDFGEFERLEALGHLGGPAGNDIKLPGLRVRLQLRDRQNLEGILATELLDLADGVSLSPLYAGSPWQRVFAPRGAVERIIPLEILRPPRRRRARTVPPQQIGLFGQQEMGE